MSGHDGPVMPSDDGLFDAQHPLELADQGCFFVGGCYVVEDKRTMVGQMFVQYQVPRASRSPLPIVMIHGGGQTGVNFLATPDGRRGWFDYFVANGCTVYVVDQPGRGRSGYFEGYGPPARRDADSTAARLTAARERGAWPQAAAHTQWPGAGVPGDLIFDQFYASQVDGMADTALLERLGREAGSALLERIGPAILLAHSHGASLAWAIADERPALVSGILAIEPTGPPVHEVAYAHTPATVGEVPPARPWGLTRSPLTYSPAISSADDLTFVQQAHADAPGLARCWLQADPPHQLPNLAGIPILIVTSEASYHSPYDHCTSAYLKQAGVPHDFVRLPDVGIHGNGHMMMLESNNLDVAGLLEEWIERNVPVPASREVGGPQERVSTPHPTVDTPGSSAYAGIAITIN